MAHVIPNKLVLVAFLERPNGAAAAWCARHGLTPEQIARVQRALVGQRDTPRAFPLDYSTCKRAIAPMLRSAKRLVPEGRVSEHQLFEAFRKSASPTWLACHLGHQVLKEADVLAADAWAVLAAAADLARTSRSEKIRSVHFLTALARALQTTRESSSPAPVEHASQSLLVSENVAAILSGAREAVVADKRTHITLRDLKDILARLTTEGKPDERAAASSSVGTRAVLDELGRDLIDAAQKGELEPVLGRDSEIDNALLTLSLKENPNPLLLGEAGVGKTSIVYGVAQRIAQGRCAESLKSMRLIEISAAGLVAGARYRGDLEERVQKLLGEAKGKVIVFVDEIHSLVGAGGGDRVGPDVFNMLKTALASGAIRMIGATTEDEYRRTIQRDDALTRRFRVMRVLAPSRDATLEMLGGRQRELENHHQVRISEEAKLAAVDLSGRYMPERQWPAKARDVLDQACALAAQQGGSSPSPVTTKHIESVVAQLTGHPVAEPSHEEQDVVATLEATISQTVIGQPEAVKVAADAIRRGRLGLAEPGRPWAVLLFAGQSGAGKTLLTEVLAETAFGEGGLLRLEMSGLTERHSVSQILGAPASYVGYEDGAPFCDRLRTRPNSVVLLEHVDRAHAEVLNTLLPLLTDGRLDDAQGRTVDGRSCVVVMTVTTDNPGARRPLGFGGASASDGNDGGVEAMLAERLPKRLLESVDKVVWFQSFSAESLEAIARQRMDQIIAALQRTGVASIELEPGVLPWLVSRLERNAEGARSVKRAVDQFIAKPLEARIKAGAPGSRARLRIVLTNGAVGVNDVA